MTIKTKKIQMLDIKKILENGKATVKLIGRLDTVTAPALESEIEKLIPGLTELIFDFTTLEYISSAGLRVMLFAQKMMNAQGQMKIFGTNEDIMEIFDITGFSDILNIE